MSSYPGFTGKAHLGTEMVIGMSYVRRLWSCGTARGRGLLWLKKDERRNLRRRWSQWIAYYHKDWSWTQLSYRWEEPIATTTAAWQERGLETPARDYAPEVSTRQREHVGAKAGWKERISNPACKDEVLVRFEGMVLHDSTSDAQTLGDLIGA